MMMQRVYPRKQQTVLFRIRRCLEQEGKTLADQSFGWPVGRIDALPAFTRVDPSPEGIKEDGLRCQLRQVHATLHRGIAVMTA